MKKYILFFITITSILLFCSCKKQIEQTEPAQLPKVITKKAEEVLPEIEEPTKSTHPIDKSQTEQKITENEIINSISGIASVDINQTNNEVTIVLPHDFFSDADKNFDYTKYAKKQGFISATLNEDQTVTVKMTKDKHTQLLKGIETELLKYIDSLIKGEGTPYIKNVTYSEDYDFITIDVFKEEYSKFSVDYVPFSIASAVMIYQLYSGKNKHVEITIRDVDTLETISSISYP